MLCFKEGDVRFFTLHPHTNLKYPRAEELKLRKAIYYKVGWQNQTSYIRDQLQIHNFKGQLLLSSYNKRWHLETAYFQWRGGFAFIGLFSKEPQSSWRSLSGSCGWGA